MPQDSATVLRIMRLEITLLPFGESGEKDWTGMQQRVLVQ
jgi:hypothetical protein